MDNNEGKKPNNGIPGKPSNNGILADSYSAHSGRIIQIPELRGEEALFEEYFRNLAQVPEPSPVARNQIRVSMIENEDQELNRAKFNRNENNLARQNYSNATRNSSDDATGENATILNPLLKQPLTDCDDEEEMIAVFVDDLIRLQKASVPEVTKKSAENVDDDNRADFGWTL